MIRSVSPDKTPTAMILWLCRRLLAVGRRRSAWVIGLNAVAGMAEGIGVLALAPLLTLLGVGGNGNDADGTRMLLALAAYIGLVAVAALVVRARGIAAQGLSLGFLDHLRGELHDAILAMEWSRFRTLRMAELQQVVTGEVARIGQAVVLLGSVVGAIMSIPFVLTAALLLSPVLTAAALAAAVAIVLATRRLERRSYGLGRELGELNRAAMADLADDLGGLRVIKSLGAETARRARINARFAAMRYNQQAFLRSQTAERAAMQVVAAAAAAAALYLAVAVLRIPLTEALVLVLAYGRVLQTALRGLSNWRQLTGAVAALTGYEETLALCRDAAEPKDVDTVELPSRRAIHLRQVSVNYVSGDEIRPGLAGIDASLPMGGITAVIGPSGAGKSTLVDLLSGLTTPDAGEIVIGDTVLTSQLRTAWRRQIAVVPQDPFVFHDTIAANLRLARPEADDAALWAALEAAAADFVRALPLGLDTVVGDRGTRLSGGERQRIVLARALLRRPTLLILDEATASLDGETEAMVAQTLAGLKGKCTVLVVAHRPSTVRAADHLLLLEAGKLVATGSWNELRMTAADRLAALGMI